MACGTAVVGQGSQLAKLSVHRSNPLAIASRWRGFELELSRLLQSFRAIGSLHRLPIFVHKAATYNRGVLQILQTAKTRCEISEISEVSNRYSKHVSTYTRGIWYYYKYIQ